MELVSYALVNLDNTKTFLGISDNSKDELLKLLINVSTDYIESQTGRRFAEKVNTNELYDGTGTEQLNLKSFPVLTFTKLEYNSSNNNTSNWQEINATDYWVDNDTGIITKLGRFTDFDDGLHTKEELSETIFYKGKSKYRATYTSGYNVVPYDIQFACMQIVGLMMNSRTGSGIKSESLGDHSITYQDVSEITGSNNGGIIEDIITKYRDIPLAN